MGCRYLTQKEITDIITTGFIGKYKIRNLTLFLFGLYTGFRVSEIIQIRVGDICRVENGRIIIYDKITVERSNMKCKKQSRTVPMHEDLKKALSFYLNMYSNLNGVNLSSKIVKATVKPDEDELEEINRKNEILRFKMNNSNLSEERKMSLLSFKHINPPKFNVKKFGQFLFPSNKKQLKVSYLENGELNKYDVFSHINMRSTNKILKDAYKLANVADADVDRVLASHSMRKTFARQLQLHFGDDLLSIQKGMGHKLITSTTCYLQYQDPKIEDGILGLYPKQVNEVNEVNNLELEDQLLLDLIINN